MANFWAGFGQGFQGGFRKAYDRAARRRDIKEAREQARADEREVLEAEADAYRELTAQLRGELQGEQDKGESATITDPHDPRLSIMANRPEMPVFDMAGDESPLSRSELLKRKITGKANYSNLAKQISDIKAQNLAEKVRRQALADKQDQRDWDKLMRDDLWGREDEQEVAKRTSDQYFSLGRSFAYNGGERPDVPPKFLPDFDRGVASVEADKGKVDYGAEVDARAAQKAKDRENQEAFNNKLAEHNYWVKRLNQIDPTLANQFAIKETPDGNRTIGEWRKEGEIPVPLSAAQLSAAVNEMSAIVKSRGERTDERMDGLDEELSKLDMFLPNDLMLPKKPAEMQNLVTLAKLRKETYDAVRAYPSATGRMGLPKPSLTQIVNMENPDDLIRLTRDYEVLTRQKNDADELAKKAKEKMLPTYQPTPQEGSSSQRFLMKQLEILNDPNASAEDKKLAEQMIELQGGTATTVYGEDGKPIVQIGRPTSRSKEDKPEPAALETALMDLNRLARDYDDKKPSIGWIATVKSGIGDSFLPQFGINSMSDPQRVKYRQAVQEFQVNYVKALNAPDSRLSDNDRKMLAPLAPGVNDSPVMFVNKVEAIQEKISRHQRLNDAFQGKKDLWGMRASEITGATFGPNARLTPELGAFAIQEKFGPKELYSDDQLREVIRTQFSGKSEEEVRFFVRSLLSIGRLGDK